MEIVNSGRFFYWAGYTTSVNWWIWLEQASQLLKAKEHEQQPEKVKQKPLTAFVAAESVLAVRLVNIIHQSLSQINRSLKSNTPLQLSLMETAFDIANLKVWRRIHGLWHRPHLNVDIQHRYSSFCFYPWLKNNAILDFAQAKLLTTVLNHLVRFLGRSENVKTKVRINLVVTSILTMSNMIFSLYLC